jgi:hypothetical protein
MLSTCQDSLVRYKKYQPIQRKLYLVASIFLRRLLEKISLSLIFTL